MLTELYLQLCVTITQYCSFTACRNYTDVILLQVVLLLTLKYTVFLLDLRAYTKIVINCHVTRVCLINTLHTGNRNLVFYGVLALAAAKATRSLSRVAHFIYCVSISDEIQVFEMEVMKNKPARKH